STTQPLSLHDALPILAKEGVVAAEEAKGRVDRYRDKLDAGEVTTELAESKPEDYELTIDWSRYLSGKLSDAVDTRFDKDALVDLARRIATLPADLQLHPRVAKIYEDRLKMAAGELPGDWGFAENLAYATLLSEG